MWDKFIFEFCKVEFACYAGEPNWLGWVFLFIGLAISLIVCLIGLWGCLSIYRMLNDICMTIKITMRGLAKSATVLWSAIIFNAIFFNSEELPKGYFWTIVYGYAFIWGLYWILKKLTTDYPSQGMSEMNKNEFKTVNDYINHSGLTKQEIIKMLRNGEMSGRYIDDKWYINTKEFE